MNRDYIERKEIGDYRISIYPDYYAECPVTNWDMGASHIFEYLERGCYSLSPDCDWKEWVSNVRQESVASVLQRIAAEYVYQDDIVKYLKAGKVYGSRLIYNRSTHLWELQGKFGQRGGGFSWEAEQEFEPYDIKKLDYRMELLEGFEEEELLALIQEYVKDFVIKAWGSCGYSQGDSMRGVSYMSKAQFDKRCGFNPKQYKTWQEQAEDIIDAEVKDIEMWAWGDVKGFVLEKKVHFTKVYDEEEREDEEDVEWEEVDSCWGYFMETDELIKEVMSEHDIKEVA